MPPFALQQSEPRLVSLLQAGSLFAKKRKLTTASLWRGAGRPKRFTHKINKYFSV